MQEDLRRLKKRAGDGSDSDSDSDRARRKRNKKSYLEEELARYASGRGRAAGKAGNRKGRRDEEDDLLKEMGKFSKRVALAEVEDEEDGLVTGEVAEGEGDGGLAEILGLREAPGQEVDDDVGWMRHRLKFVVDEKELTRRAEDEYAVSV